METAEFKELYSERYKIEAKNSELKSNFGYNNANACGKSGITIQGASALFLANIKRIIKLKKEKSKIMEWNIIHTGVDSKYQGQGIAKRLVKCVIENSEKYSKNLIAECSYAKKLMKNLK